MECLGNSKKKKGTQITRHRTNLSGTSLPLGPVHVVHTSTDEHDGQPKKTITVSLLELRRSMEKNAFWHKSAAIAFLGIYIYNIILYYIHIIIYILYIVIYIYTHIVQVSYYIILYHIIFYSIILYHIIFYMSIYLYTAKYGAYIYHHTYPTIDILKTP